MKSIIKDNTLNFVFLERLDTVAAMSLQKEITDTIAANDESLPVVFDFSGVDYIASGFIRICIIVVRMKGKKFRIVNVKPEVRKVILLTGLDRLIVIE
jgi:anti-anti-sigma factor